MLTLLGISQLFVACMICRSSRGSKKKIIQTRRTNLNGGELERIKAKREKGHLPPLSLENVSTEK